MCLIETYNKVRIGGRVFNAFHIQNYLKEGDVLSPLLFNFALEYPEYHEVPKKIRKQN